MKNTLEKQQRALVTGASSGIGAAFARQLAERGLNLVLTARSRDKLHGLAQELTERHGIDALVVVGDLAEPGGAQKLCADVDALGVDVHHLINNAGVASTGTFHESNLNSDLALMRLDAEAPLVLMRHFLPAMVRRGSGGVLNVASAVALRPLPHMASYGASKAFVLSLSVAVAEEVRSAGVTVMALCPGPVPTGFQQSSGFELGQLEKTAALSPETVAHRALRAYEAGDAIYVPGNLNQAYATLVQMLPRRVTSSLISGALRRMGRA